MSGQANRAASDDDANDVIELADDGRLDVDGEHGRPRHGGAL
ncbi:MAG TPA: hypothetical protein VIJ18_06915 [Microbacteriaceae bacterium]